MAAFSLVPLLFIRFVSAWCHVLASVVSRKCQEQERRKNSTSNFNCQVSKSIVHVLSNSKQQLFPPLPLPFSYSLHLLHFELLDWLITEEVVTLPSATSLVFAPSITNPSSWKGFSRLYSSARQDWNLQKRLEFHPMLRSDLSQSYPVVSVVIFFFPGRDDQCGRKVTTLLLSSLILRYYQLLRQLNVSTC